jgi:hypothetical protein
MAGLRLGDAAPSFDLPGVDGGNHSLSDYEGRAVAVVFSCCHCPYVVAWEDRINAAARDYDGRAGLVAVNSNAGYLGDSTRTENDPEAGVVVHLEARDKAKRLQDDSKGL